MAAVSIAKSGAGHYWVLLLTVAPSRAPFGGSGDCTSCSYGMDKPIWDVLNAPGGAGWGAFRKSGSGRTPGPQNPPERPSAVGRLFHFKRVQGF